MYLPRFLRDIITIGLIVSLLLPRGILAVSPILAQETTPSVETVQPEPTTSQPTNQPDDVKPTTAPQPTSTPQASQTDPQPTSAPKPKEPRGNTSGVPHESDKREETVQDRADRSDDGPAAGSNTGEAEGTVSPTPGSHTVTSPDPSMKSDSDNAQSSGGAGTEEGSPNGSFGSSLAGPNGTAAAAYLSLYGATAGGNSIAGEVNDPANLLTGAGSNNSATETTDVSQETLNKNIANLTNLLAINASTGFNYANLNTLPGYVETGNADNTLNLFNKLNTNISGMGGFATYDIYGTQTGDITFTMSNTSADGSFASASGQVAKNAVTGPESNNTAAATQGFTVKEANGNDAQINNTIALKSITGDNSASFNTLGGSLKTGNAHAFANIINMANTNILAQEWLFGVVNIYGSLYGNIVLPADTAGTAAGQNTATTVGNATTGPLSDNTASSATNDTKTFTTANTAEITSNLAVDANTGNNDASFNTYGASIETGDAQSLINNTTVANVNAVNEEGTIWMVIVNEMGKWVGKIIGLPDGTHVASSLPFTSTTSGDAQQTYTVDATNTATGPLSQNDVSYTGTSDQTVTSENTAAITNNIVVKADTGNNEANYNTGHAAIKTGNATAGINLLNMANVNLVAKKVVVLFVNVLGSFFGDIVLPDQKKERDSTAPVTASNAASPLSNTAGAGGTGGPSGTSQSGFQHASNEVGYVTGKKQTASSTSSAPTTTVTTVAEGTSNITYGKSTRYYNRSVVSVAGTSTQSVSMTPAVTPSKLHRGIFISPAFAAAGESTPFAMLFRGERVNVTNAWLVIVPFALAVLYIRRRHRIDLMKHINGMLGALL